LNKSGLCFSAHRKKQCYKRWGNVPDNLAEHAVKL
jgi:hypothetical protein